jgi:hypothetical protein
MPYFQYLSHNSQVRAAVEYRQPVDLLALAGRQPAQR